MAKTKKAPSAEAAQPIVLNVGCGQKGLASVPPHFASWRVVRVDVDESVEPDIVGDATDLSKIADESIDAVYSAHCIEHLYAHDVSKALAEFHRVLKPTGFACIIVPDLQTIAQAVVADKIHEPLYMSASGPVTPHDIIYGFGPAIAAGHTSMAHRSGFTPALLARRFQEQPFAEIVLRRRPGYELMAVARRSASTDAAERDALLNSLL